MFFVLNKKKTASSYTNGVLKNTSYTCAATYSCPANTVVSGTGIAYLCCSTPNCNNGTVPLLTIGISCNQGNSQTGLIPSSGCTTFCQVRDYKIKIHCITIFFSKFIFFCF